MDNSLAIRDYLTEKAHFPDRALIVWIDAASWGELDEPPEPFSEDRINEMFLTPYDAILAVESSKICWSDDYFEIDGCGHILTLDEKDLEKKINSNMKELVKWADAHRELLDDFGKFLDKRDADVRAKRFPIEITGGEYQYAMDVLPPINPEPGVLEKFGCVKGFCVSEPAGGGLFDTYGKTADGRMWYLGLHPGIYDLWNRKPRSAKKPLAKKKTVAKKTTRSRRK